MISIYVGGNTAGYQKLVVTNYQCWGVGTFSPAPSKKGLAPGSWEPFLYKFLLPAPAPNSSKKARLPGAVFRGFYWLPLKGFNGSL